MSQKESPFDLSFLGEKLDVSKFPPLQIVTGKDKAVSSLKVQPRRWQLPILRPEGCPT